MKAGIYQNLPYTRKITSKGKDYYYILYNKIRRKILSPDDYTNDQCMNSYITALNEIKYGKSYEKQHLVSELLPIWQTDITRDVTESTAKAYKYRTQKLAAHFGHLYVDNITFSSIHDIMDKEKSVMFFSHAHRFFAWCVAFDYLNENPIKNKKLLKTAKLHNVGYQRWPEEDITQFRQIHPVGTPARLVMEVLLNTGARISDVLKLTGNNLSKNNQLHYIATKNQIPVTIQLPNYLVDMLTHTKNGEPFISKKKGRPISYTTFREDFAEARKAAGIDKPAHGLRKSFATRLAAQEKTELQIMAAGGWKTTFAASLYVKEFERSKAGLQATFDVVDDLEAA